MEKALILGYTNKVRSCLRGDAYHFDMLFIDSSCHAAADVMAENKHERDFLVDYMVSEVDSCRNNG